jgi:SAM-dependent methyltransferase
MAGEKKYGISTTGFDELKSLKKKGVDIGYSTIYMPASYFVLEDAFRQIPAGMRKHFVDIGCGKGRALCVAAHNGFAKTTGVDFSEKFCAEAEKNLQITMKKIAGMNYSVILSDAASFSIPSDADCIFFFNPFNHVVMQQVTENIMKSIEKTPRNLIVFYINPLYKEIFFGYGFTEFYHKKSHRYFEVALLKYCG